MIALLAFQPYRALAEAQTPRQERIATAASHDGNRTMQSNASRFLIGRWECTTFGGTHLTHDFESTRDLLLVSTRVLLAKDRAGTLRERYRFHEATSTWTVTLAKGKFVAQAPLWNDASWTFLGRMVENGKPVPSAMTYEKLADTAYRRDFKRRDGDGWTTYAGETCRRD